MIASLVLLRVVWLDSDAYSRLSWSSALLTDEGFYIHNARNLILFGHARTDDFNNALIMPLLHFLQVAVFRVFGVGMVQARSISVVCSLLTLLVVFCALRRAFSPRVAWLTLLLLGFDPVFTLYNRLALMDTPACLPLVCAFYAWVRAGEEKKKRRRDEEKKRRRGEAGWLAGCGVCLGLAYTVRGLAAVVLAVPFLLLLLSLRGEWLHEYWQRKEEERVEAKRRVASLLRFFASSLLSFIFGLVLVLGIYALLWYLPHHQEIAKANAYYLHHQLLPRNTHALLVNLQTALIRPRGVIQFLLKHSPAVFLAGCLGALQTMQKARKQSLSQSSACYMIGWFCILLLFDSVVDYAPSRYYVLFYPALAGLAALSLDAMLKRAAQSDKRALISVIALILTAWGGISVYWYADWSNHITYRQRDADRWLAAHLPPNSVLIGAVAPGLCLNNHFKCVPVIEDLCNDKAPIERFADALCYILILDGNYFDENDHEVPNTNGAAPSAQQIARTERWKERWWMRHYPDLVRPQTRLHAFPAMLRPFFTIGVYPVPPHKARPRQNDHTSRTLFKPEQD